MSTARNTDAPASLIELSGVDRTRAEVRQFLGALLALAFVLSTFGVRDGGTLMFSADIVLALCGAWCANQLIRGKDIFRKQMICVLQAYFVGLVCCAAVLFAVGWLAFLPVEYFNLGTALVFAASFTTNIGLALFPVENGLRFDGLLDHLWVPALLAQCVLIVSVLYWTFRSNSARLLLLLCLIAGISLSVSTYESPIVQLLPIGGLWAFLFGAIPFLACNRYPILNHALPLGIVVLMTGVLAVTVGGESLLARAFLVLGISLLYLGSRPMSSAAADTLRRRRLFGLALHVFLWIIPLSQVLSALNLEGSTRVDLGSLVMPALFLSIMSWSIWRRLEQAVYFDSLKATFAMVALLMASGVGALWSHGANVRYDDMAKAYLHAIEPARGYAECGVRADGPLAGLRVCEIGPQGAPTVLIWGDHQLAAMTPGYAEAARRAEVSALIISNPNCIPLDGLQTRLPEMGSSLGRTCEQHSAQILQALPHLKSIRHVTLVADWLYYTGVSSAEYWKKGPVRLGPNDGTPINADLQTEYVATAADRTIQLLVDQGLRVSVLRQVPAHPQFDAEIAARANAPAGWLYYSATELQGSVPIDQAEATSAGIDQMFRRISASGRMTYVNTWPTFCSGDRCVTRGGLSSDYVTSTKLSSSGALSLSPVLEEDLRRSRTHTAQKRAFDS